jgi:type III secretion protein U
MAEKTEQPTPKKLRDARKKGNVAKSQEVVTAALTIALFGYFWATWGAFMERMEELLVYPPTFYEMPFSQAVKYSFDIGLAMVNAILVPIIALTIIVGIFANVFMTGVLFAGEGIKPSLDKINPVSGAKKIFGIKNLVENLKSIIKVVFLTILLTIVIVNAIRALVTAPSCGIPCLESVLAQLLKQTVIYTSAAFIIVAAADYAFQKAQHIKGLKMTKDEVKREYKESEGDPLIKSMRKALHQEMVMSGEAQAVRKASVVVTNPTHIAVALRYESGETPVPMVIAKGENLVARRMVEIAREEGIPVMENVPLARELFDNVGVDRYIPADLIEPVAEVLRWVRQLQARDDRR